MPPLPPVVAPVSPEITTLARIPEHSVPLMCTAARGTAFQVGDYLFVSIPQDRRLVAVGYPVRGGYSARAFAAAVRTAMRHCDARSCDAVAPRLPASLLPHMRENDRYLVIAADAPVPASLRGPLRKAGERLRLEEARVFTAAHRRLWGEFLGKTTLPPHVRALYGRVEALLTAGDTDVCLLNAWDGERLAACLVIDAAPGRFDTYLLGAHSREYYVPHASDALFGFMLERARQRGKRLVHLGLGVNEGISRFKRKWGGRPALRYQRASWKEQDNDAARFLIRHLQAANNGDVRLELEHADAQRPFRMLWEVVRDGKTSWIGGTAHFFRYSFETAFRHLFKKVDTVIFEGHLDEDSLDAVSRLGKRPPDPGTCLFDLMTEEEIRALERVVRGPEGPLWRLLNAEYENKADVRWYLRRTRPWFAFFSLWTAYLERMGWRYSVDLEAWRVAHRLGKRVLAMEDIGEQVAALESVPPERAVNHFRACRQWGAYLRANAGAYLTGDLEGMMGTSTEFPTRTGLVISERDQRFRERMRPYLERGRCCVLVGSAHMLNLRGMLAEDGFSVRPLRQGWTPLRVRIREALRKDAPIDPSGGMAW